MLIPRVSFGLKASEYIPLKPRAPKHKRPRGKDRPLGETQMQAFGRRFRYYSAKTTRVVSKGVLNAVLLSGPVSTIATGVGLVQQHTRTALPVIGMLSPTTTLLLGVAASLSAVTWLYKGQRTSKNHQDLR